MYTGQLVFSQVTDHLPMHTFRRCVQRYQGERYVKHFRCLDQYLSMAFAQLTYRESLRDIEACLRAHQSKLYHMGIRSRVVRSTLSDANEQRDWRIYADFAQALIRIARPLYTEEDLGPELDNTVYALDASTIDLCLSVFPWASFRSTKSAVKLHTLLDLRGNIPTFIHISDGKLHDVNVLDILLPEAGAFYIMDRGFEPVPGSHFKSSAYQSLPGSVAHRGWNKRPIVTRVGTLPRPRRQTQCLSAPCGTSALGTARETHNPLVYVVAETHAAADRNGSTGATGVEDMVGLSSIEIYCLYSHQHSIQLLFIHPVLLYSHRDHPDCVYSDGD
jgi:hypothetical protein